MIGFVLTKYIFIVLMSKASYFFLVMIRMMNSILSISFGEYDYKTRPKQIIATYIMLNLHPKASPKHQDSNKQEHKN